MVNQWWCKIQYYFRYKFPWMIRRRSDYNRDIFNARNWGEREANLRIAEREKLLDDLLPKLFKVSAERGSEYGIYKCAVSFNTGLVDSMFLHGNSQEEIHYIARRLAAEVERQLHTINFARIPRP